MDAVKEPLSSPDESGLLSRDELGDYLAGIMRAATHPAVTIKTPNLLQRAALMIPPIACAFRSPSRCPLPSLAYIPPFEPSGCQSAMLTPSMSRRGSEPSV
jgi:hypothetical protein